MARFASKGENQAEQCHHMQGQGSALRAETHLIGRLTSILLVRLNVIAKADKLIYQLLNRANTPLIGNKHYFTGGKLNGFIMKSLTP